MKPLGVLVRDSVAPLLRARGFTRSAGTFRARTDRGVALIQISGRQGVGQHDYDFHVEIGFVTHEYLASPANRSQVIAERIGIGDTYQTWHSRVRDPGLTAMDDNQRWRFNQGDAEMLGLFRSVLAMAADDVLARLQLWPQEPRDSLSTVPVFSEPIEREGRSRWRTDPHGRLDLHYASSCPVLTRTGSADGTAFVFEMLHDESEIMINLAPDALGVLAPGRSLATWAEGLGFRSAAGHAMLPGTDAPDRVTLRDAEAEARLVIAPTSAPAAVLELGEFPQPQWTRVNQWRSAQVVLVAGGPGGLSTLTWTGRRRLADAGDVWFATVGVSAEGQHS